MAGGQLCNGHFILAKDNCKREKNLPILFVVADGTVSKPPGRYSENHGNTAPASPG